MSQIFAGLATAGVLLGLLLNSGAGSVAVGDPPAAVALPPVSAPVNPAAVADVPVTPAASVTSTR